MKTILAVILLVALSVASWSFTGKVVDGRGRPVAKATVSLWMFWTGPRTFHADKYGELLYSRNTASDGTVYITICKIVGPDGKPVPDATVTLPWYNNSPIRFLTDAKGKFSFQPLGYWDGINRVTDRTGAPVPHAHIIRTEAGQDWKNENETDDKGEYRVPEWQPETGQKREFGVNVIADGYTYASVSVDADKTQQAVIKLSPERIFSARIVDEAGAPVRGARVVLDDANGKMKDGRGFSPPGFDIPAVRVISGKDGKFELRHLPDDNIMKSADITLTVGAPGRAQIVRRSYRMADLRKSGVIMLPRSATVQGVVRPPAGGKLVNDLILQMRLKEDGAPSVDSDRSATVGADGRYRFDNLPPGEAEIVLWTTHRRTLGWTLPAVEHLRITAGEVKDLDMVGSTGAVISGTVRDKATGKPMSSTALTIEDASNPKGNWWLTERDGTYSLRVAPGKVRVYVSFVFVGDKQVYLDPKDGVSAEVADGDNKTGMDLTASIPSP